MRAVASSVSRDVQELSRRLFWIAVGRLLTGASLIAYVLTYRGVAEYSAPSYVRPAGLVLVSLMTLLGSIQLIPRARTSKAIAVAVVILDVVVAVGLVGLYSFDPRRYLFALMLLVAVEGALVWGLLGGLKAWATVTVGYLVVEIWGGRLSGVSATPAAIFTRVIVGLLLVLVVAVLARDVSAERKERLAEREGQAKRLNDLVWDVPAIVWEADASNLQFVFVSHRAEGILGYSVKRWLEEPDFRARHVHRDDRDLVLQQYRDGVQTGTPFELTYRMIAANGSELWMIDRVNVVRDSEGRVRQLRGVLVDATKGKRAEDALRTSFRLLFDNNPNPMWAYDRDTLQILAANDAAVHHYGYSRSEFLELRITDVTAPEDVDRLLRDLATNQGAFQRSGEWRHRRKDGRPIEVEVTSHTLEFEHRRAALVVAENITEQRRAEKQLREAEARYRTLVERIPAVTYVNALDAAGSTLYISPQAEALLGYTQAEWRADPYLWEKLLHADDRSRVLAESARARASGESFVSEYRLLARDGRVVWVQDESVLLREETGRPRFWQGVMVDITERKRAEQEVAYLAYHDNLTDLPNRAMFEEMLDLALARGARDASAIAVLYVDLDDFKLVNDSLGHPAGDGLLRQLGVRIRSAIRETDVVARLGGDEFLILLSDVERSPIGGHPEGVENSVAVAETVARRIHDSLRAPFVLEGTEVYISASIGISMYPFDAEDGKALLKNSDTAMYRSKQEGPGGYMIFADEAASPLAKLSFTTRLRKAVSSGDWVLHYQPIIDLLHGTPVGVEALIRWRGHDGALIPPGEFIPLAEEMGLIEPIGDWVVEELCRQTRSWRDDGLGFDVTFNLSARQLWQPDLVEKIIRNIESARLDPSTLIIEVTESAAMTNLDETRRMLWELHRRGVRMAIDDFGTGYSSLSRLKHLPIDILKIDRSFIGDIPSDKDACTMVKAIVQLATSLGMRPLAEGIETAEQWRFLLELGCPLGQGFHFSRPVPARAVPGLFRRTHALGVLSGR
jgi:diguanylate cyclase (GGDEF)-like protein/PAS domain S-box-containing protein